MTDQVFLGYPTGGKVDSRFEIALQDLRAFEAANPSGQYALLGAEASPADIYPAENRNRLVLMAWERGADWLLQLDPDETFNPMLLRVLMRSADAERRPIVVGHYANVANMDFDGLGGMHVVDMVFRETDDGQYQGITVPADGEPFEVDAAGAGILLTHLSVFERLAYPWFEEAYLRPTESTGKDIVHPRHGRVLHLDYQFMNEDLAFFRKVRQAGYRVWCDPLAEATHWKVMPLVPSTTRSILEDAQRDIARIRDQREQRSIGQRVRTLLGV